MSSYTRKKHQPYRHIDSDALSAAFSIVEALESGAMPNREDLEKITPALKSMLGGTPADVAWGLAKGRGKPPETGFITAEIVSAYIELDRRKRGNERGALARAKEAAVRAFFDQSAIEPMRKISEYWSTGKALVPSLSDEDLRSLISLHQITDEK